MAIQANQYVTGSNERVFTDDGQQGMRGKEGIGSSTERQQGHVAAAIYANCAQLDNRQLEGIIEWVRLYKKCSGKRRSGRRERQTEVSHILLVGSDLSGLGGKMISGEVQMRAVPDRMPNKQCWMLFKVADLDRLQALQRGLLYMNSVDYFAKLEGEAGAVLRRDELENVYLKLSSGIRDGVISELALQVEGDDEIILSPETTMTLHLPRPETVMVYCLASVSTGHDGKIWGLDNGVLQFSERFREFGTHVLRITNHSEFARRLSQAIATHPHLYNSPFFEGGYGQVDYVDFSDCSGPIGLFRKPLEYAWQREYRICLGAEPEALNDRGALELNIGDLSDITQITTVESFTSNPMTLVQRSYRIIDGKPVQVLG